MLKHDSVKKHVEAQMKDQELAPGSTGQVDITTPIKDLGDNIGSEKIKMESAGLIGATSDQVIMGSPAAEYGSTGRFALDGIIAASDRIAREKYRETHEEE